MPKIYFLPSLLFFILTLFSPFPLYLSSTLPLFTTLSFMPSSLLFQLFYLHLSLISFLDPFPLCLFFFPILHSLPSPFSFFHPFPPTCTFYSFCPTRLLPSATLPYFPLSYPPCNTSVLHTLRSLSSLLASFLSLLYVAYLTFLPLPYLLPSDSPVGRSGTVHQEDSLAGDKDLLHVLEVTARVHGVQTQTL